MNIMRATGRNRSALVVMILFATVMLAITLCMGCSSTEETTGSDYTEETAGSANAEASTDTAETPVSQEEEVTVQPEEAQPDDSETEEPSEPEETGFEEAAEPEAEEDADEWTALYNDYKNQGVIDYTFALSDAGYNEICLVNGTGSITEYFSPKDGNYHTITANSVLLYVPKIPVEFNCDNENIEMHYWYNEGDVPEDDFINCIHLYCPDFDGDDVPVTISVTFEDGSTQEIMVYLTHHVEAE